MNQQQQHQQQTNNQVQNHSAINYHNNRGQHKIGYQTPITANRLQFQPHGFNYEEWLVTIITKTHVILLVKTITLSVPIRIAISTTTMEAPSVEIITLRTTSC